MESLNIGTKKLLGVQKSGVEKSTFNPKPGHREYWALKEIRTTQQSESEQSTLLFLSELKIQSKSLSLSQFPLNPREAALLFIYRRRKEFSSLHVCKFYSSVTTSSFQRNRSNFFTWKKCTEPSTKSDLTYVTKKRRKMLQNMQMLYFLNSILIGVCKLHLTFGIK